MKRRCGKISPRMLDSLTRICGLPEKPLAMCKGRVSLLEPEGIHGAT